MFLARRMHWMVFAVIALAASPLALSAQAAIRPSMIAFAAPAKSLWAARTPKASKNETGRGFAGGRDRAQPSPKGKDSIAQAIEANRSVPWSIVLGLTLLTLLPALLLSITPMVRLLVV